MTVRDNEKDISDHEKRLTSIEKTVKGNGNRGMDEIVREIERRVTEIVEFNKESNRRIGVLESDMKEVKSMLQEEVGYAGVKFSAISHPSRRVGDSKDSWLEKTWDRITLNILDKFITAVIIIVLVNGPAIIEKFLELLK